MPLNDAELLERMNARTPPTSVLLGTRILEIDSAAGRVRMSFVPRPEFCNPMGNVQGGFIVAMLDDCAAVAAIVKSKQRIVVPTIELKTSFFAPAKLGQILYGEARCIKLGVGIDRFGNIAVAANGNGRHRGGAGRQQEQQR